MKVQYIPEHTIPRVGALYRHRSARKFWFDSKTFEKVAEPGELVLVIACDCRRDGRTRQCETVTTTVLRSDGFVECGTYQHQVSAMHPNEWGSWWEEVSE
jgi:hypothetical protein